MKKFALLFLILASISVTTANAVREKAAADKPAADPKTPDNSAAPAETTTPPAIEVKNKSSFSFEASSRNPFWQIGWKPAAKLADPGSTDHGSSEISAGAFLVSSITLGRTERFAIVNGKVMQEGQQFGLQLGGQTYQITVKTIADGRVVFGRRDQEIVVPLRRK